MLIAELEKYGNGNVNFIKLTAAQKADVGFKYSLNVYKLLCPSGDKIFFFYYQDFYGSIQTSWYLKDREYSAYPDGVRYCRMLRFETAFKLLPKEVQKYTLHYIHLFI